MSFISDLNSNLSGLKTGLENLFQRSKEQILSLLDKSNSSFIQLLNIFSRNETLEDNFVDGSRIFNTDGLIFDKDGWTNIFNINEVKFKEEYFTRETFLMQMEEGQLIPGSNFSDIFFDREGFWGFLREDGVKVQATVDLTFNVTPAAPALSANRIYLRTNNVLDVEVFYRESFGGNFVSLGTQSGQHHLWTTPFTAVEIRFQAVTDIFAISFIQIGNAIFNLSGTLTSTYFEVENLRLLSVGTIKEEPDNTKIRRFVNVRENDDIDPPLDPSGWIPWETEKLVTLANDEIEVPVASGFVVPSGFMEESFILKTGHQQWEELNTTDLATVTDSVDRLGSSQLNIDAGDQIIVGGLKALFIGEGESRTEFDIDNDFTVVYDIALNTVAVQYVEGGRLPTTPEVEPTAEILLRKPVAVVQRRTFVDLEQDGDITITIPTSGITVRTLHIGDTIEDENSTQNVPLGVFTFEGKKGLNLIEIEGHSPGDPPVLVGTYTFFSNRFRQKRVQTPGPESNEYYLEPSSTGFILNTPESDLFLRYLLPTGKNFVAVRFELEGTNQVAPLLRGYKLFNRVDTTADDITAVSLETPAGGPYS